VNEEEENEDNEEVILKCVENNVYGMKKQLKKYGEWRNDEWK